MWFMQNALAKPDNAGAGATDYMHLFGLVAMGYMWAQIAKAAQAKQGARQRLGRAHGREAARPAASSWSGCCRRPRARALAAASMRPAPDDRDGAAAPRCFWDDAAFSACARYEETPMAEAYHLRRTCARRADAASPTARCTRSRRSARRDGAARAARSATTSTRRGRGRRARLRRSGRRGRRRHRPRGGARGGLRQAGAGRADQPLLRLGPRRGEPRRRAGHGRPAGHDDRRRRRIDEPRRHGRLGRRLAGRPAHRDPVLLHAAGHLGRPDRHQVRLLPRRRATPTRSRARSAPPPPGTRAGSRDRSCRSATSTA